MIRSGLTSTPVDYDHTHHVLCIVAPVVGMQVLPYSVHLTTGLFDGVARCLLLPQPFSDCKRPSRFFAGLVQLLCNRMRQLRDLQQVRGSHFEDVQHPQSEPGSEHGAQRLSGSWPW